MKRFFAIVAFASLTAAAGCQQDQKSLSAAPPPPPAAPPAGNPNGASFDQTTPPATFSVGNNQTQTQQPVSAGANQSQSTAGGAAPEPMRTASAEPTPAPAATTDYYTIRKGDTLWSIAARLLGDGQKWQQIVDANPGLSPTKLRVGQKIVIPQ